MSNETREISNQDGQAIALYEIVFGDTVWRYTSADQDVPITVDVEGVPTDIVYTAIPISDDGMSQGGSSNNDITVTCVADIPLVDLFHSTPPSTEIWLTVRRMHEGEADTPLIFWTGTVSNVKRKEDNASAEIIGQSLLASFGRAGLRLAWTRGCAHMIYDSECKVNKIDFAHNAVITALSGNSVTIDDAGGFAAGYFDGGMIEWEATAEGTIDRRGISASLSDTELVIYGTTYRLEVGMAVTLYPGCNLTTDHCKNKFDNLANYGGVKQMTGKNPFDGTALV